MPDHLGLPHAPGGTAARALAFALGGGALAAGLHHATTDSSVSWQALAVAVVVLATCARRVLRSGATGGSALALAAVQALLPVWLEFTDTEIPARALDDHLRLPSALHHDLPAMAALNFLLALALVHVFRCASDLPERLSYAVAAAAHRCWDHVLHAVGLILGMTGAAPPGPPRPPLPAVALPRPCALTVLLHRVQPCAP
ncbi:hypothetical protein [Streptomyces sp. H51]|uniref:hypothetical protein n=1 Tax=Streptomyces sp. H51 TaxID=3111770 RepID=UPI002D767A19|nr:hypothetical protein [Streptomyces sp. H51]